MRGARRGVGRGVGRGLHGAVTRLAWQRRCTDAALFDVAAQTFTINPKMHLTPSPLSSHRLSRGREGI